MRDRIKPQRTRCNREMHPEMHEAAAGVTRRVVSEQAFLSLGRVGSQITEGAWYSELVRTRSTAWVLPLVEPPQQPTQVSERVTWRRRRGTEEWGGVASPGRPHRPHSVSPSGGRVAMPRDALFSTLELFSL